MQYLHKGMGDEVYFFPKDDCITLGVCSQACPKYPKQQVYNIFGICQGNVKDEVDFLLVDKHQRVLFSDTIVLDVYG